MQRKILSVIALTLCVLTAMFCLTACGSSDSKSDSKSALIGTWEANEAEGTSYIFEADGKGKWDMGDTQMNFTYAGDGKTVEITYEGTSTAQKWTYSISGDTLTMTNSDEGSVLTYTKK